MKNKLSLLFLVLLGLTATQVSAQQQLKENIISQGELKSAFDKKFHWGVSLNIYLTGIEGPMVEKSYFYKPSLGGTLRAEYYLFSWLGIGAGAGYQQRGAGIYNQDVTGGAFAHPWITNDVGTIGDPDSTHLERLRFNTLEFPVTILLRTPKDVFFPGMRLSAAAGPTLIHLMSVNLTYQSVVDGFHPYDWITDNYTRNNIGFQASLGVEIDSGGGHSMCQVHFVYTNGIGNVYAKNQGEGYNVSYGIRIAWLF